MRFINGSSLDAYMNALNSWSLTSKISDIWLNPSRACEQRTATDTFEEMSRSFLKLESEINKYLEENNMRKLAIKKVIYRNPATIVYWNNGDKTVVKCSENETFDPENGLAMAIIKHLLGNEGNYYNEFKKFLPKEDVGTEPVTVDLTPNMRK